jgi:hypothetical protein
MKTPIVEDDFTSRPIGRAGLLKPVRSCGLVPCGANAA